LVVVVYGAIEQDFYLEKLATTRESRFIFGRGDDSFASRFLQDKNVRQPFLRVQILANEDDLAHRAIERALALEEMNSKLYWRPS